MTPELEARRIAAQLLGWHIEVQRYTDWAQCAAWCVTSWIPAPAPYTRYNHYGATAEEALSRALDTIERL